MHGGLQNDNSSESSNGIDLVLSEPDEAFQHPSTPTAWPARECAADPTSPASAARTALAKATEAAAAPAQVVVRNTFIEIKQGQADRENAEDAEVAGVPARRSRRTKTLPSSTFSSNLSAEVDEQSEALTDLWHRASASGDQSSHPVASSALPRSALCRSVHSSEPLRGPRAIVPAVVAGGQNQQAEHPAVATPSKSCPVGRIASGEVAKVQLGGLDDPALTPLERFSKKTSGFRVRRTFIEVDEPEATVDEAPRGSSNAFSRKERRSRTDPSAEAASWAAAAVAAAAEFEQTSMEAFDDSSPELQERARAAAPGLVGSGSTSGHPRFGRSQTMPSERSSASGAAASELRVAQDGLDQPLRQLQLHRVPPLEPHGDLQMRSDVISKPQVLAQRLEVRPVKIRAFKEAAVQTDAAPAIPLIEAPQLEFAELQNLAVPPLWPGWPVPHWSTPPPWPAAPFPEPLLCGVHPQVGHDSTLMLRNLPQRCCRDDVTQALDFKGLHGCYDFVYMPRNLRTFAHFGYIFVHLYNRALAEYCHAQFQGFAEWPGNVGDDTDSGRYQVCDVHWAEKQCTLLEHMENYRDSPVMHPNVPDEAKPTLFYHGLRVSFPSPTKPLKEPRIRRPPLAVSSH